MKLRDWTWPVEFLLILPFLPWQRSKFCMRVVDWYLRREAL
jgi:hypothetical protein